MTCTTVPDPVDPKRALRRAAYARRREAAHGRREAGERCTALLERSPLLDGVGSVACYVSMGTEISTLPMLGMLLRRGVETLVPRLGSGMQIGWSRLDGPRLRALAHVERPARGVLRPDEPDAETLPAEALAACGLIVAPALRVDARGTRLGRGGGWYDRALPKRRPGTPVVAVCWPWEFTDGPLPARPYDVPVDAVLTPERLVVL